MKKLAAILLLAVSASAAETSRFKVALPDGFSEFAATKSQAGESTTGKVEAENWLSRSKTGEAVVVTVTHLPSKVERPAELLTGARVTLLKMFRSELEREQSIPGTRNTSEYVFHSIEGAPLFFRARVTANPDSMVQMIYVGRSEAQRDAAQVGRMFQSFQIK